MYLKSIEIHGFKSFANKIKLEFHNGITGIVGPNGSGKSNVSDAVRWVLGEQSAKQLRGSSMQDVIFAGTQNRKPLSYAYVAITMDNSDHVLDIDFEEVTVARRVYRSGESEYLINGSPCRLRDIQELFYDTGIGKEGYSIIGQGQIERILSGKPEERRELFDEAAGIVKFKRRKATAQKKLESERENLIRVNDILSELERQVEPLRQQSEKAKIYLNKKQELKTYDINLFLMDYTNNQSLLEEVEKNDAITKEQLEHTKEEFSKIKDEYEKTQKQIQDVEENIEKTREEMNQSTVTKGKLEGQINVLNEQIRSAETADEMFQSRVNAILEEQELKKQQLEEEKRESSACEQLLCEIIERSRKAKEEQTALQREIARCNQGLESGKNELLQLAGEKGNFVARKQKCDTMLEQINIKKAQINQKLLHKKTKEADFLAKCQEKETILKKVEEQIRNLLEEQKLLLVKKREWNQKRDELRTQTEEDTTAYHRVSSRLESLKNIAERYDGYGNSIKKVMERKEDEKGILGVVSDLIKVEAKYETAIETALGGSIQNIVTEDEATAARMIEFLKQNRYGRATFLPITSVKKQNEFRQKDALKEPGVIGLGSTLVESDKKYEGIIEYLLGRVVVVDDMKHGIALAKKYHYSLNIVTLEGESLRPGGSMTGGAFRNNSNLLGRNREIEDLTVKLGELQHKLSENQTRKDEIDTARALLEDDLKEINAKLQTSYIEQNTANLNVARMKEQQVENDQFYQNLKEETKELELEAEKILSDKEQILKEMEHQEQREAEIEQESEKFQEILDEQRYLEASVNKAVSEVSIEEASIRQKSEFAGKNVERIEAELLRFEEQIDELKDEVLHAKEDAVKKKKDIEEIKKTLLASDSEYARLDAVLNEKQKEKEQLFITNHDFFDKQEEVTSRIAALDKEIFRLNSQRERYLDAMERQSNYMWEEYELTLHAAMEQKDERYDDLAELKKLIAGLRDDIRKLGDVNVNAIEEYKDVSERYTFLKTQHDDLVEAEATLVKIIDDLDTGMRKQFTEKFAQIQQEFDKSFKELFGGGKGTLELVEGEDILECGIRIVAQPPGKKLQNMVLLSGGEKSLTAIALLFAIQNLKPSPFCLLDEIEAALDDSNVGRFAEYLHKLTKYTQFIVITHRRGTMTAADRLYGITMQEKGISTLVSVNLIEHELKG